MQTDSKEPLLNRELKVILVLFTIIVIISFCLFRNLFFQSTYLLKSFGELSIDPEIAFKTISLLFLNFTLNGVKFAKKWLQKYLL